MKWVTKEQWLKNHPNSLDKMSTIAEELKNMITPMVKRCEIAGSIRREKPICNDIDLVVLMDSEDLESMIESTKAFGVNISEPSYTKDRDIVNLSFEYKPVWSMYDCAGNTPFVVKGQIFITLNKKYFGGLFLHRTGSRDFNVFMSTKAKRKGRKLSMYGLFDRKTNRLISGREKGIFDKMGLLYVYPKNRNIGWLKHMGWWCSEYEYQDLQTIGVIKQRNAKQNHQTKNL